MLLSLSFLALAEQPKYRPTDMERGEELYRRHCVQCHGVRNRGDGPVASVLVAPVPNLEGKVDPAGPQVDIVLFGRGHMPGYEATFHKQDAVRVLKYQATLGTGKSLGPPGAKDDKDAKKPPPANKPPPLKPPGARKDGPEGEDDPEVEDGPERDDEVDGGPEPDEAREDGPEGGQ